jgi:glycosyltransferase involved in cell wall biosynthesis
MKRILVLTGDIPGRRMAGPAIRAFETAQVLAGQHRVTLACPRISGDIPLHQSNLKITSFGTEPRWSELNTFDAVIAPGSMYIDAHFDAPLLIDLYDPFILSSLARTDKTPETQAEELESLNRNLARGDFFVCASDRQRDFWIGMLAAAGRVNTSQFKSDSYLNSLIQTAPFGVLSSPPAQYDANQAVDSNNVRLVWGGGIWDWFDPLTPIRAVSALNRSGRNVSLHFMGTGHPNPNMTKMTMADRARTLAADLQLLDKHVFFHDWIPYSDRGDMLCSAAIAVSTHYPHLETQFSFRTRILDYIWARLPFVCTQGDYFADLAYRRRTGLAVPSEDVLAFVHAVEKLIDDTELYASCKKNLDLTAEEMTWEQVLKPVVAFCDSPVRAVDAGRPPLNWDDDDGTFLCGCENAVVSAGEIVGGGLEQQFETSAGALCRIDLKLATFQRRNTGYGLFELLDVSRQVRVRIPFDLVTVEDNRWRSFRFGPIPSPAGTRWTIRLTCPVSKPGNAVTIWTDNTVAVARYRINGVKMPGSVNYRVFSKTYSGFHTPTKWRNTSCIRIPFLKKG